MSIDRRLTFHERIQQLTQDPFFDGGCHGVVMTFIMYSLSGREQEFLQKIKSLINENTISRELTEFAQMIYQFQCDNASCKTEQVQAIHPVINTSRPELLQSYASFTPQKNIVAVGGVPERALLNDILIRYSEACQHNSALPRKIIFQFSYETDKTAHTLAVRYDAIEGCWYLVDAGVMEKSCLLNGFISDHYYDNAVDCEGDVDDLVRDIIHDCTSTCVDNNQRVISFALQSLHFLLPEKNQEAVLSAVDAYCESLPLQKKTNPPLRGNQNAVEQMRFWQSTDNRACVDATDQTKLLEKRRAFLAEYEPTCWVKLMVYETQETMQDLAMETYKIFDACYKIQLPETTRWYQIYFLSVLKHNYYCLKTFLNHWCIEIENAKNKPEPNFFEEQRDPLSDWMSRQLEAKKYLNVLMTEIEEIDRSGFEQLASYEARQMSQLLKQSFIGLLQQVKAYCAEQGFYPEGPWQYYPAASAQTVFGLFGNQEQEEKLAERNERNIPMWFGL